MNAPGLPGGGGGDGGDGGDGGHGGNAGFGQGGAIFAKSVSQSTLVFAHGVATAGTRGAGGHDGSGGKGEPGGFGGIDVNTAVQAPDGQPGSDGSPGTAGLPGAPAAGVYPTVDGLRVTVTALSLKPASLPPARNGKHYSTQMSATSGNAPYTWTAYGLSSGIVIGAATGEITGTPTQVGTFRVQVAVHDAATQQRLGSRAFTLTVST